MDDRHWLNELRAELARQELPPLYVERLVWELSDHLQDVKEDTMSMEVTDRRKTVRHLGTPVEIATTAVTEYRRARFSGRHPILMFALMPVVSLVALWASSIVAIVLTAKGLGMESNGAAVSGPTAVWIASMVPFVVMGVLLIPVVLASVFFCRLASKAAVSWKWSLLACGILAVIGGLAVANIVLPIHGVKGSVTFGLGVSTHPSALQLLQFVVPLTIGGWAAWRQASRHREVGVA